MTGVVSGGQGVTRTFGAGSDLSTKQYFAVAQATDDGYVDLGSSAGQRCDGILLNKPDAEGAEARVCISGPCRAKVGGNVTPGIELQVDTDGMLIAAAAEDYVVAICREDGVDGDIVDVDAVPNYQKNA